MAVVVDNYSDTTYTLVLNSLDRIAGGSNSYATFQVNWNELLPTEYERYKMVFTFQTTGGYYADGLYLKSPLILRGNSTSSAFTLAGSNTISVGDDTNTVAVGMVVNAPGVLSGTTVIAYIPNVSITLSQPTFMGMPTSTVISYFYANDVNPVTFSAARIAMSTGTRSYSFDTSTKAPSINLGIIKRDIQTSQPKKNTLSSFYCQNPPRTIGRPNQNLVTISVYNNCFFQGGVTSITGATGPTFSTTSTNMNLLTDTYAHGSIDYRDSWFPDMTPWSMFIEFIPVKDSRKQKFVEM